MKRLTYAVTLAVLLAVVFIVIDCNRHDEALAPVEADLVGMAMAPVIEVIIDIVPHKPANRVNCTAKNRIICVGIMSENGFDATTVDHTTVVFQEATEAHLDEFGDPIRYEKDIDEDGDKDLVMHFLFRETNLSCDSTRGCLDGKTLYGDDIHGCDSISMFSTKPD